VRTGAAPDRVTRLLRRMFPRAPIPEGARFVLTEGEGRGVPVRELFSPERGFGTAMLWVSFFVTFMLLVTNTAWSPILLKAEGMLGLSLGCGSSGLIVLAALFYPTQIRSTGVGWSMGMGRFGSFVGPLVVGALVAAKLPITTVFLVIGLACLIPVIPCALTG